MGGLYWLVLCRIATGAGAWAKWLVRDLTSPQQGVQYQYVCEPPWKEHFTQSKASMTIHDHTTAQAPKTPAPLFVLPSSFFLPQLLLFTTVQSTPSQLPYIVDSRLFFFPSSFNLLLIYLQGAGSSFTLHRHDVCIPVFPPTAPPATTSTSTSSTSSLRHAFK